MQMHEQWLLIAKEDLASAKYLLAHELVTTLFHSQQCAEKSLKAYLVFKKRAIIKTHDLVRLVDTCLELSNQFEVLRPLAATLTPYETAGRYPDNTFKKPSQNQIQNLIEQSEFVFDFVIHQIKK